LDASVEMKRTKSWERLEELIIELQEFVQLKVNVHKVIKSKSTSIVTAFRRLQKFENDMQEKQQGSPSLVPKEVRTSLIQRSQHATGQITDMETEADAESDIVTDESHNIRSAKRKQRPSPEVGNMHVKRKKEVVSTPPRVEAINHPGSTKKTMEWQVVQTKKNKIKQ